MKTVKLLFFSVVFTLTFCFAAFASEKKIPATENFTNDVVYDNPRNLENADANNLAAFFPQIEKFQVKSVRVYPVYQKPGDTEDYYDSNIYVKHNISGNDWGQNNFLEVSPETTERLLHIFDEQGYQVVKWIMEMDCYNTYKHPLRYQFKSLDGGVTASGGAYSGMTRTFDLVFPVQNTTQKYGNGYKGTFTYTSVTGNVVSLEAGGYVYLNSSSSDAQ